MIKIKTKLKVIDNSGAKFAKCIKIIGKGKKKTAKIITFILVTLQHFINRKKVQKRIIYLGLIVGIKYWFKRFDGTFLKFFSNRIIIFNKQYKFLGTRVYGVVTKELKKKNFKNKIIRKAFQKIITLSFLII
jgi:large subunit ribosomal protein L14